MINRAIIIGSGASIRQNQWDVDIDKLSIWSKLKDEFTIGCNWSYKWIHSTVLMYSDYQWYGVEQANLKDVALILGREDGEYQRKDGIRPDKNVLLLKECETKQKLIHNNRKIGTHAHYWGRDAWTRGWYTSQLIGIKALNLAIALGYTDIYLLGFDACSINEHTHFYDDTDIGTYTWNGVSQSGVGQHSNGNYKTGNYNKIEELNHVWFQPFEQELENNVKIYNVSLQSKINTFPKISWAEFLYILANNKQNVNHDEIRQLIKDKLCKK